MTTIPDFIFKDIDKYKNKTALVDKSRGVFKSLNFIDLKQMSFRLGESLLNLGVKKGDRIAIFSENRTEWVIADLAIQLCGAITVTIHSVFASKYIKYVLKDSGVKILFVSDKHLFEKLHKTHQDLLLDRIIYFSQSKIFGIQKKKFKHFKSLIKKSTAKNSKLSSIKIKPDDPATIIYTSGTTGLPKGVVLTHKNILSNIKAILKVNSVKPKDRLLSFLPLSHVLERTAGYYTPLSQGAEICFAENYTTLLNDLIKTKPTIIIGVPRIFEKAYEKMKEKKMIPFLEMLPGGKKIISFGFKKKFGGHLKYAVCGGAALDKRIGLFLKRYGLPILEGYGLTETSPVIAVNSLKSCKLGSGGKPLHNLKIKISQDGELLVKGPSVTKEYWNLPQKTKEAFTADKYFKTGDFAKMDKQGFLHITGRKKNIIVLSTGKNVQPEEIESTLDACAYIERVMVVGDGKKMVTALIIPEKELFKTEGITKKKDMIPIFEKEINFLLKDFPAHEKIKRFFILHKPFTVEADELTPTLKLKRHVIEEHYSDEIKQMYL